MARNKEKSQKCETNIVGPGIWRENWKTWKMRHKHNLNLNMARNTQKLEK
jgi:hypothetical protein